MITPPAPILTPEEAKQIPGLIKTFMNAFEAADGRTMEDDAAIVIAAMINAWPNANKAYFAQGPHLMLPLLKS